MYIYHLIYSYIKDIFLIKKGELWAKRSNNELKIILKKDIFILG